MAYSRWAELGGLALGAYLVGSLPTGYLACRWVKGEDIRGLGSGNTGATNALRVLGRGWGGAVLAVDVAKGFLPVYLAGRRRPGWTPLAAAAAVLGHSKSIWLGFGGGKAVATGAGTVLALDPPAGAALLALWGALAGATRYVSVASVGAAVALPLLLAARRQPPALVAYGAAVAALVLLRHRANLARLRAGTEPRLGARAS